MQAAAANFAGYRTGSHAFALGRFVAPVSRLEELEAALPAAIESAWRISALASASVEGDIDAIRAFNARQKGRAVIDSVELRAQSTDQVEAAARLLPGELTSYVEIPLQDDPAPLIEAIGAAGRRAKIRTGGVTADAFPPANHILRFLSACATAGVPFKATAGLHHPLRCHRPLTYSAGGPEGWMYGFLNVFLTAAWIRLGVDPKALGPLLEEQDAQSFRFDQNSVSWRVFRLSAADLERIRQTFAIAFGSCSFEEPIGDLQTFGLLLEPGASASGPGNH
jgi:hypothetical protein